MKGVPALIRAVMLPYETSLESAISKNSFGPAIARKLFIVPVIWEISAAPPSMSSGMPPSLVTASPVWICLRSYLRSLGCPCLIRGNSSSCSSAG
jgi:hypothetical protein